MMKTLKAAIATVLLSIKSFECIVICVLLAIDVVNVTSLFRAKNVLKIAELKIYHIYLKM